jgi:hypothetical protein
MPTRDELSGIAALDRTNPSIDMAYFPNTSSSAPFWSSFPYAGYDDYAWAVGDGGGFSYFKYANYHVQLVRIGQ